jgi:hypothetical protein
MSGRFKGTVALVAGGTGGLGGAVSLAFLEEDGKMETKKGTGYIFMR